MKIILSVVLAAFLLFPASASAQNTALSNTTLAASVTSASTTTIRLTATTGLQVGDGLFVDSEYMTVNAINTTSGVVTVSRGAGGVAGLHASGARVYYGRPTTFRSVDPPAGQCSQGANPNVWINIANGNMWVCGLNGDTPTTWAGTNARNLTFNSVLLPLP